MRPSTLSKKLDFLTGGILNLLPPLALLGIAQRHIKAERTPETGIVRNRKPLGSSPNSQGDRFRYARKLKGFTQQQLAEMTGLSVHRIQTIEGDAFDMQPEEIAAVERQLGIPELDAEAGA